MRLKRLAVERHRKLRNFSIDFALDRLTTVMIGENGTGKSTVIEVIAEIFRNVDLGLDPPLFDFEIEYLIDKRAIVIRASGGEWGASVDGANYSLRRLGADGLLPDLVFGYYSGDNNRLEALFDYHQERYYDWVKSPVSKELKESSPQQRRLFFCRPVHGVLALIASFAFPEDAVHKHYQSLLGISAFHQAILVLKKPWWGKGAAEEFWLADGRPKVTAEWLRECSFFPITTTERARDDYRSKGRTEERYALFLNGSEALKAFRSNFKSCEAPERVMFEALESLDISDMYRWVQVWLQKSEDESGEISYGQLSDGERQVLMVLGLMWVSRGKNALFLLDEPDTHLNPMWQLRYLEHIKTWCKFDHERCQVIMSTHNPLTIASLEQDEIRVLSEQDRRIVAQAPYFSPRGIGFSALLTEIFGLPTTLDPETQRQIDDRNTLARMDKRTEKQDSQLIEINEKLDRLGFLFDNREPLYSDFLKAVHDVRYANKPVMTPDQVEARRKAMAEIIRELTNGRRA